MSFAYPHEHLTSEVKATIIKHCVQKRKKDRYNPTQRQVNCFAVNEEDECSYLPLGLWKELYDTFPNDYYPHPRTKMKCTKTMYTKETDPKKYRDQDVVVKQALKQLKAEHTVFLALPCGFGKTSAGNYLSCALGYKTLVISHLKIVNEQWVDEYKTHSTAKVQHVKGSILDPNADVYVMGVRKAALMPRDAFKDIGTVIFDEAHIATITAFTESMLNICPRYLIGLSATPDRADGMHKLLSCYFGSKKNYIVREETKDFTVFKVQTPFVPNIQYKMAPDGVMTLDWNEVINSLAYNEKRQAWAIKLVMNNPAAKILILTDRVLEAKSLHEKLINAGVDTDILVEGTKSHQWNHDCRVLVAGLKKAGVGFDDASRTVLILMTDKIDVRQFEGRIRTVNNKVYDFVDNYKTFESHWSKSREPWYLKRGATIKVIGVKRDVAPLTETHTRFLGKMKPAKTCRASAKATHTRFLSAIPVAA